MSVQQNSSVPCSIASVIELEQTVVVFVDSRSLLNADGVLGYFVLIISGAVLMILVIYVVNSYSKPATKP